MKFRVSAEHVNGELVHSFFDEQDMFTGLELVEEAVRAMPWQPATTVWLLRYDGQIVEGRSGPFTFQGVAKAIEAVEAAYHRWEEYRRKYPLRKRRRDGRWA